MMKKLALALAATVVMTGAATARPHHHASHGYHGHRHAHHHIDRRYGATAYAPRYHREDSGSFEPSYGSIFSPVRQAMGAVVRGASAVGRVIGGRPSGCPHAFCGCALSLKIFGRRVAGLDLALNWKLRFPRANPAPGMVAARSGHVWQIIGHGSQPGKWLGWDANSGGGRIRIHERSIAGFTIVNPRG
jgi:hypothetical protein